jgi:molybdenum cofactor guanylyltransferase
MGEDKALISFAGKPLIARAIEILRNAGLAASIAGAHCSLDRFAAVVADAAPDLGPLSGICAALAAAHARLAVFLPVDMPLMSPSLIATLVRHAQITESAVTVPSVSGFAQTFPSVVDRAALPALKAELAVRRLGCFAAFGSAAAALDQRVSVVPVELLVQAGQAAHPDSLPAFQWFLNVNTPDDLHRAESLIASKIA